MNTHLESYEQAAVPGDIPGFDEGGRGSRSSARFTIYTFAFWTICALFSVVMGYAEFKLVGRPMRWGFVLLTRVPDWYFWAAVTPFIFWLGRRYPLEREKRIHNLLVIHLPFGLAIASIHILFVSLIWYYWILYDRQITPSLSEIFIRTCYFLPYSVIFYWAVLAVHYVFEYNRRYQETELQAAELKTQLSQSHLRALQMQLKPHFLFNTLNSISALTHKNPTAANDMLARLSKLLRISLTNEEIQEVPLEKELVFLRTYLEIEQVRFQDRLKVNFNVESETLRALVPSLILQPLVENSIRHGITRRRGNGVIDIYAIRKGENLILRVRDNGLGVSKKSFKLKEGVGLTNTRRRLQNLYGPDYQFSLSRLADGGIQANIIIPFRTDEYDEDSYIDC